MSAWGYSENQHMKLHCRHHETETPLNISNMVSMASWAVSLRKSHLVSLMPLCREKLYSVSLRTETSVPKRPEMLLVSGVGARQAERGRE